MKAYFPFVLCLLVGVIAIPNSTLAAPSRSRSGPRYQFKDSPTNIYSVQIEVRGEGAPDILGGNLQVVVRPLPTNNFSLTFRGMLVPKRESGLRVPSSFSNPRWYSTVQLTETTELQMDNRGRVLRLSGDYPLPIPLGTLAQAFVEPLPETGESRWETTDELAVMDDPQGSGPASAFYNSTGSIYYPTPGGRNAQAVVPVTRKQKYDTKAISEISSGIRLIFQKKSTLESLWHVGNEPRFNATGEGELEFDLAAGLLRRVAMEYKTVSTTEAVTKRATVVLSLKLLTGKERDDAVQTITPRVATLRKLSADEVEKIIADLKSSDATARSTAASKLQSSELTAAPPALMEIAVENIAATDSLLKIAAVKIIGDHGTAEHVPILLRILKEDDYSGRYAALRGLGRLKDKRAIEPLVSILAGGGSDSYQITEILGKIGPDAEDAVLGLFKERHTETQRTACNILKVIGTQKSLPTLQTAMMALNQSLSQAASEALRAIKARD
jgi:hypothetical protein